MDRAEQLSTEEKSFQQRRVAIDRGKQLSIEGNIDRTEKLLIEENNYRQNRIAIDRKYIRYIKGNKIYVYI